VNQDGPSSGLTVPNGQSQQRLIKQALAQAQVKPSEISYLEAHEVSSPGGTTAVAHGGNPRMKALPPQDRAASPRPLRCP
ncbi:MAG: hypothetical protein F6K44_30100, partial [Moorea sp. SIO3E2]|nr:hypothetical protein [Moorena sp. SIO3E2]